MGLIGITSPFDYDEQIDPESEVLQHAAVLRRLGAVPVILARGDACERALQEHDLDGVLFTGGGDIDPARYGGRQDLCKRVDTVRDRGEFALFETAYAAKLPILCVCRGLQIANVALGGTLIEDIRLEMGAAYSIEHHQVEELGIERSRYVHLVTIVPGSLLHNLAGGVKEVQVNSVHHQAIRALASGLMSSAHSTDGIIEAIELRESEGRFFLGVEWHPESLAPHDRLAVGIFQAFLAAAARRETVT